MAARVHITVVDRQGNLLGAFRMGDGTNFSFDTAVQKARTAMFFSDDTHAFSATAIGFMAQAFFPPGIANSGSGPLFHIQNELSLTPGNLKGRLAEKKTDPETAEKEYRAAIEATHGSALTWFNLALFYRHQQRWNDMEGAINHAVSAQMDRPEILMESGEVLLRSGRNFPAAVQFLRRYLALTSKVEEAPAFKAHYLLGTALERQGDKQAAAQEYRAALSLAKGFSRAQQALDRLNP